MKIALPYKFRPQITEPCQSADKILFGNADSYVQTNDGYSEDSFFIWIYMQVSSVKVIEQKRAYELQTLIGNSGGYIGLLLGTIYIHIHNVYYPI